MAVGTLTDAGAINVLYGGPVDRPTTGQSCWPLAVSPALGSSSQKAAATAASHTGNSQTLRLTAVFTEFDPNIDLGAPGFSLGDEVVFSGNLLRNGQQLGRTGVVCSFVSTANPDRVEAQCPTTSIFPGGHHPRYDRQPVAELHPADHRRLRPLPGRRRTGGLARLSTPTQPQVELTYQLEN